MPIRRCNNVNIINHVISLKPKLYSGLNTKTLNMNT